MRRIDLSCDLGEVSNAAQQQIEDALWPMITSANVACGGHAGDEKTMRHAAELARRHGVQLGAHPSYPDREGFGRKSMKIDPAVLRDSLVEQISALEAIARIQHVKAHGALYNDAHHDDDLALVIAEAVAEVRGDLAVVCSAESAMFRVAGHLSLRRIAEAFADRRYQGDGSLVPRSRPDALLLDSAAAAEQALMLAERGKAIADDGEVIRIALDTICVHGDMPNSVERLQAIRARLTAEGFSFGRIH